MVREVIFGPDFLGVNMFLTLIALLMIPTVLMMMEDPHLNACVDQTAVVGLQLDVNLRRQSCINGSKGAPNDLKYMYYTI